MKSAPNFLRSLFSPMAWTLILIGLFLFTIHTPVPSDTFLNLPAAATVVQTAGLMFTMYGVQMIASMAFWPQIRVAQLLAEVLSGRESAMPSAVVLMALLLFNAITTLAFVYWTVSAMGFQMVGR